MLLAGAYVVVTAIPMKPVTVCGAHRTWVLDIRHSVLTSKMLDHVVEIAELGVVAFGGCASILRLLYIIYTTQHFKKYGTSTFE